MKKSDLSVKKKYIKYVNQAEGKLKSPVHISISDKATELVYSFEENIAISKRQLCDTLNEVLGLTDETDIISGEPLFKDTRQVLMQIVDWFCKDRERCTVNNLDKFVYTIMPEKRPRYEKNIRVKKSKEYSSFSKYNDLSTYMTDITSAWNKISVWYKCFYKSDLVWATLYELFQRNKTIRKCRYCGLYFVPYKKADEKYCKRGTIENPGKTCSEIAKEEKVKKKRGERPDYELYHRIDSRLQKRQHNEDQANQFRKEYAMKKERVSKIELVEWLKKQDEETKKRK